MLSLNELTPPTFGRMESKRESEAAAPVGLSLKMNQKPTPSEPAAMLRSIWLRGLEIQNAEGVSF